jgi:hypothetical protein
VIGRLSSGRGSFGGVPDDTKSRFIAYNFYVANVVNVVLFAEFIFIK